MKLLSRIFGILLATIPGFAGATTISKAEYADRLRAMWLAENIANWSGLTTEGEKITSPFFTDTDWETQNGRGGNITTAGGAALDKQYIDFIFKDPWPADDDTDIEYSYMLGMERFGTPYLSGAQIADIWQTHVNRFVWVSNARARALMDRRIQPPATGMLAANDQALMIDAQLTTEFFGALAPARPDFALRAADLPIRNTAAGNAAHAAQFFVVMNSLAAQIDPALPKKDQVRWLVTEGRKYIPDSSKSADIIDFVLTDYDATADKNNWESTRNKIYTRYQSNATANGYVYEKWFDSLVNLGGAVTALLYGQGDLKKTIRIGALSGWDSDNGTASMAGLLGLTYGTAYVRAAFPGEVLSDRFKPDRTRDVIPAFVAGDTEATDNFTQMAARMMPLVEQIVLDAGGSVSSNSFTIAPYTGTGPAASPTWQLTSASANVNSGPVATASLYPHHATGYGTGMIANIRDGVENDFSGAKMYLSTDAPTYWSSQGSPTSSPVTATVIYNTAVSVKTVRFIEGDHFTSASGGSDGGWFANATVQLLVGGSWQNLSGNTTMSQPHDSARPFQVIDYVLPSPVNATAVRITGTPGGSDQFVTIAELDTLSIAGDAPETPATGGLITASSAASPSSVNFTSEGTLDWIHWAHNGFDPGSDAGAYGEAMIVRKNGVHPQISTLINMGGKPIQGSDFPTAVSWNDGTSPTPSVSGTNNGVWHQNDSTGSNVHSDRHGLVITAPADTNERVLKVYLGTFNVKAVLTATLSDGSTPDFSETIAVTGSQNLWRVYSFTYKAASPGQTLNVRYRVIEPYGSTGTNPFRIKIQGATLAAVGTVPVVQITAPSESAEISPGDNVTLTATASSGVSKVEFFNANTKLGEDTSAPFSFTWNNVPAGTLALTAKATSGSKSSISTVRRLISDTGLLTATFNDSPPTPVNLTSGTLDWIQYGQGSGSSLQTNRSTNTPSAITAFTVLQKISPNILKTTNNNVGFTWSNGSPLASTTNRTHSQYLDGFNAYTKGESMGFQFTVPADTTQRTLKVWVSAYAARGRFEAYLSDGSAPTYSDNSAEAIGVPGGAPFLYTLNYRARTNGQRLIVVYRLENHRWLNDKPVNGNIGILGASLSGSAFAPEVPTDLVTSAITSSTVQLNWEDNVFGELGYMIERKTDSGGTWTQIAMIPADSTSYLDGGLATLTSYFYRVRANDGANNSAYSNESSAITGTPANQPPTIALSGPTNNSTFTQGAAIGLTAIAADSDGSVTKVEFFQGITKLGEDTAAPYAFNWTIASVGTYVLIAKSTDNSGATTTSASVSITAQSSGGGSFDPATIADLKLWISADSGITADSADLVSQWTDQSSTGNNVTASGSARPILVANGLNGMPVLRFNGSSNYMTRNAVLVNGNTSVFAVIKAESNAAGRKVLDTGGANALNRRTLGYESSGLGAFTSSNPSFVLGTWAMSSAVNDGTNTTHWIDGANPVSTATGQQLPASAPFSIGSRYSNSDRWPGDIAEILVYDAVLSPAQRLQVENYLLAKWLSGSLPPTPAAAPSDIAVSAVSSSAVDLVWSDNSTDETVFLIERKTGTGGSWAQIATPGANTQSFSDTGLTPSTTFYYRVRSAKNAVTSPFSNEVFVSTLGATLPPLLICDFESGNADNWGISSSIWSVGPYAGHTKALIKTGNGDSTNAPGDSAWTSYAITAAVNLSSTNGSVGILGRKLDNNNYYELRIGPGVNTWNLLKRVDGNSTTIATGTLSYTIGTWATLRLVLDGNSLVASYSENGTTFTNLTTQTDSSLSTGRPGVRSYQVNGAFDDFVVTPSGGSIPGGEGQPEVSLNSSVITTIISTAGDRINLQWYTPRSGWILQYNDDLEGDWNDIGGSNLGTTSNQVITPGVDRRFFRLRRP